MENFAESLFQEEFDFADKERIQIALKPFLDPPPCRHRADLARRSCRWCILEDQDWHDVMKTVLSFHFHYLPHSVSILEEIDLIMPGVEREVQERVKRREMPWLYEKVAKVEEIVEETATKKEEEKPEAPESSKSSERSEEYETEEDDEKEYTDEEEEEPKKKKQQKRGRESKLSKKKKRRSRK